MKSELLTTAKELCWKAWYDGYNLSKPNFPESEILLRNRFELWWDHNYGNSDSTVFYTKTNIYVENRKYIQAE